MIAIVGYAEDKGFYVADTIAGGVHVGGESNYVEALHGIEVVLYPLSGEIHTEAIDLIGFGVGPEAPGVAGLGLTAGNYQTAESDGNYWGLQGGALGAHGSAGIGSSAEPVPNLPATPSNGTEGNQGY